MVVERILFGIDGLRRHWLLFLLPIVVGIPIAFFVLAVSPTKYEAKSTVLMVSANRDSAGGVAGFPRQGAVEQIAVLEAWLKSDQVLTGLLPQLLSGPAPTDPEKLSAVIAALRRTLTLQLTGASVLEIRLESTEAKGLGRRLEIILTRLLEGVLNPEAGILSATQMIIARRGEAVTEAEAALTSAVEAARIGEPAQVMAQLKELHALKQSGGKAGTAERPATGGGTSAQLEEARTRIASDRKTVEALERLYEDYEEARITYAEVRQSASSLPSSYVRVFDAPERLTIVGRPRDPLTGTSSGRKLAIAVMFLAILASLGLVGVAVTLDPRLRHGEEFAAAANGLPVLARLPAVNHKD